jgi:hypothetical protein
MSATETKQSSTSPTEDSKQRIAEMLAKPSPANEGSLTTPEDRDQTKRWRPSRDASLNDEETKSAKADLLNTEFVKKYSRSERSYADPVLPAQVMGLISFVPASGAKANKNGIFGFAKLRGNYSSVFEADQRSEKLIRDHDSYNQISMCYVGRPFPLTENRKFSDDVREIDINKEAAESMGEAIKRQQKKDAREMTEIKDREALLKEDVKKKPGDDPYEEYITMRVKRAQLVWTYEEHKKKMAEVKELIINTRKRISDMNEENPEYDGQYFEKYKKARLEAGLDETTEETNQNFMKYLVEDIKLDF